MDQGWMDSIVYLRSAINNSFFRARPVHMFLFTLMTYFIIL